MWSEEVTLGDTVGVRLEFDEARLLLVPLG